MVDDAYEWLVAAVIVVIGSYVVADMIESFIKASPLFGRIIFGGGVLAAIVFGAKRIFA